MASALDQLYSVTTTISSAKQAITNLIRPLADLAVTDSFRCKDVPEVLIGSTY